MTEFGSCASNVCFAPYRYTGKERDTESGNDYFGARYYSSAIGRFMSPDWSAKAEPVPYSKLDDPQTLNLYAYVENHPLNLTDESGHGPYDIMSRSKFVQIFAQLEADQAAEAAKAQQQSSSQPDAKTAKVNSRAQSQYNKAIFAQRLEKVKLAILTQTAPRPLLRTWSVSRSLRSDSGQQGFDVYP